MSTVNLVFPHQLFEENPLFDSNDVFILVEEYLFFRQYNFHKQKIAFHRATMRFYEAYLVSKGFQIRYVKSIDQKSDIRKLIKELHIEGVKQIRYIDPTDNWLEKRLVKVCKIYDIELVRFENPLFLNTKDENKDFFKPTKKKFFQTKFYTNERKKRMILIEGEDHPVGGKWTYDMENRKKYPAKMQPHKVHLPKENKYTKEAKGYVEKYFSENVGKIDETYYPIDFESSKEWLDQFLENRFHDFGTYEDAIVKDELILNHSVLTPMLNVGLLTPQYVIDKALQYSQEQNIPINSTEGFIRQIIGWREFIRCIYESKGTQERTTNFWGFTRKIPASFYDGTTGIEPIDTTIKKVLKTGYCHHIERLMILGNFMLLCEFDPDEVYRWFMELFIDAYDWVMVPNIYGMSQFADGGLMSTKPYISGSNYLKKMSNYKKGDWQPIWDGLFWRFMHTHRSFFLSNPRLGMLVRTFDKMSEEKQETHLKVSEKYLDSLAL